MAKSIEEQVEDIAKKQLDKFEIKYFTKTEGINEEIDDALKKAESKSGGKGGNFPDIKVMIKTHTLGYIPVMIEVKGTKNCLKKINSLTDIVENRNEKGEINYSTIKKYAVNGAVHYAESIINYTKSYKKIIERQFESPYSSTKLALECVDSYGTRIPRDLYNTNFNRNLSPKLKEAFEAAKSDYVDLKDLYRSFEA